MRPTGLSMEIIARDVADTIKANAGGSLSNRLFYADKRPFFQAYLRPGALCSASVGARTDRSLFWFDGLNPGFHQFLQFQEFLHHTVI